MNPAPFLQSKRAPLFVIPAIAAVYFGLAYGVVYPAVSGSVTSPLHVIAGIAAGAVIVNAVMASRLFTTSLFTLLAIWSVLTAIAFMFVPGTFEGNPAVALAAHFMSFQLGAVVIATLAVWARRVNGVE